MLRSVAVLHVLEYYLYWITSNYGVKTLSVDDGSKCRRPVSTQKLRRVCLRFLFCCVCATSRLSIFHTDRCCLCCLCPGCVRLSHALRACVEFCALRMLRLIFFYARRLRTLRELLQKPPYVVAVVEFCVYLIHLPLWYCKSRQRSFVRFFCIVF